MDRKDFYEKYGVVKVKFTSYYKYVFTFKGEINNGGILTCDFGGDPSDIYRFDVEVDKEIQVIDLQPFSGSVSKDGKELDSFCDY